MQYHYVDYEELVKILRRIILSNGHYHDVRQGVMITNVRQFGVLIKKGKPYLIPLPKEDCKVHHLEIGKQGTPEKQPYAIGSNVIDGVDPNVSLLDRLDKYNEDNGQTDRAGVFTHYLDLYVDSSLIQLSE